MAVKKQSFFPTDEAHKAQMVDTMKRLSPEPLRGQTPRQKTFLKKLRNPNHDIIIVEGPAGSGKTYMTMRQAIDEYIKGNYAKLILTRPTVSSGQEDYGYLPGSLLEKLAPWVIPLIDVCKEYWSPLAVEQMLAREEIEIAPLGFMRGRTLKNAFIIVDEAQNMDIDQTKMIMTRLGEGSRMVITGDREQTDLKGWMNGEGEKIARVSGLAFFIDRLEAREAKVRRELPAFLIDGMDPEPQQYRHERIVYQRLGREDVVRHPVIDEVLDLFG